MTNEVIRTDCATLGAKIDWFNGAVARAVDEHGTLTVDRCDAKTVEELLTMIDLSVSCGHTPTRVTNTNSYERAPSSLDAVPTLVEQMSSITSPLPTLSRNWSS